MDIWTKHAEGSRSTKTTYSNNNHVNITTYHYCNGELLYETVNTDPANVIHALYIRTPAGALEAVSLNYAVDSSSNTFYYYHYNAHGDVIAVTKKDSSDPTNITGKIYRQYAYDPYGNIISAKDGSGNAIDINNDSGFDDCYKMADQQNQQYRDLKINSKVRRIKECVLYEKLYVTRIKRCRKK